jgi:hypothetical protein
MSPELKRAFEMLQHDEEGAVSDVLAGTDSIMRFVRTREGISKLKPFVEHIEGAAEQLLKAAAVLRHNLPD